MLICELILLRNCNQLKIVKKKFIRSLKRLHGITVCKSYVRQIIGILIIAMWKPPPTLGSFQWNYCWYRWLIRKLNLKNLLFTWFCWFLCVIFYRTQQLIVSFWADWPDEYSHQHTTQDEETKTKDRSNAVAQSSFVFIFDFMPVFIISQIYQRSTIYGKLSSYS